MKSKKAILSFVFAALIAGLSVSSSFAQDKMRPADTKKKEAMTSQNGMLKEDTRPIVAIIKADWCAYCKRIDPVVSELMKDYSEKLNFVVFDVTDDQTTAKSKARAEKLGLAKFFDEFKGKTSAVAVLKDKKVAFKTFNNSDREVYVAAFDQAIE